MRNVPTLLLKRVRSSSIQNVGKAQQVRFYMNVHTRPSHSGMFDKENPPKPPSPKRSYTTKLMLLVSVAIGLNFWLRGSKEEERHDVPMTCRHEANA